jgi:hypothetical protein
MKSLRKLLIIAASAFGLLLAKPVEASAGDIICWYMGDVRDSYGRRGAMWYCEMWHRGEFLLSYTTVERY